MKFLILYEMKYYVFYKNLWLGGFELVVMENSCLFFFGGNLGKFVRSLEYVCCWCDNSIWDSCKSFDGCKKKFNWCKYIIIVYDWIINDF